MRHARTGKACIRCGCNDWYQNRDGRFGCAPCIQAKNAKWREANKEKFRAIRAAYRSRNKEKLRASALERYYATPGMALARKLKQRYGLTLGGVGVILGKQEGCCAICTKAIVNRYYVDHCHATGKVRGLLCMHCNTGLGHFQDNPETIRRAAAHVESWRAGE